MMRQNRRNTWKKGHGLSRMKENLQLQGLGGQLVLYLVYFVLGSIGMMIQVDGSCLMSRNEASITAVILLRIQNYCEYSQSLHRQMSYKFHRMHWTPTYLLLQQAANSHQKNGIALEWHQIHYLKQRKKNDLVMDARESLGVDSANVTAVDQLLADLENDPNTSYVCLFGKFESGLWFIKTKCKTMNNSVEIDVF